MGQQAAATHVCFQIVTIFKAHGRLFPWALEWNVFDVQSKNKYTLVRQDEEEEVFFSMQPINMVWHQVRGL